jgi:predicted ATP-grasp superfamily ATP-dependent carboligase
VGVALSAAATDAMATAGDALAHTRLDTPPVLILGGEANALSVARDLSRMGVAVYALGEADSTARHSRHLRWIDLRAANGKFEQAWANFLLGTESDYLRGAVVLACSDAGLTVLATHREALLRRFRLDESNTSAQLAMLNKLTTYKIARDAGVTMPKFWEVSTREQILSLRDELVYPLLVKPRLSHLFEQHFGRKHITATSFEQLISAFDKAAGAGMDMLLVELIPGGDEQLCSYYTYLDEHGEPQFHFTKRVIRRFPTGMGSGSYHITDWNPALCDLGLRLFRQAGLRGLANVEFKQDPRDGQYKLIECNARFTAANCLVSASGCNIARYVYERVTGRTITPIAEYRRGVRLWDPVRDFWAFRELRKSGNIGLFQWLWSIMHRQTFPYFRLTDPKPALARLFKPLGRKWKRLRGHVTT